MIQHNHPLDELNTFGLSAKASHFAEIDSTEDLKILLNSNEGRGLPLFILGGGSNILLTQDLDALCIKMNIKGRTIIEESEESITVEFGAGEVWHDIVLHCISKGWGGIENMSLIPGTVGAAPMQNIGAYGAEIKDVFVSLDALHIATQEMHTFDNEACEFGYRQSIFKQALKGQFIICRVRLKLSKAPTLNTSYGAIQETLKSKGITEPTLKDVSDAVIEIRQSKLPDPKKIGNSGSFFKNPEINKSQFEELQTTFPNIVGYALDNGQVKVPAGWLIEQDGWKGKRIGDIGVHKNQALVLVNYGRGEGAAIKQLAFDIQASVKKKYGILLQPEVNII